MRKPEFGRRKEYKTTSKQGRIPVKSEKKSFKAEKMGEALRIRGRRRGGLYR